MTILLNELYEKINELKNTNTINMSIIRDLQKNIYRIFETQPYYVSCFLELDSIALKNYKTKHWNKNESLYGIYSLLNNSSFKYTNIHIFYESNDLINKIDLLKNDTYIVLGIKKINSNNSKLDKLLSDAKISTWETVYSIEDLRNTLDKLMNEDVHIFRLSDNVLNKVIDNYKKAEAINEYLVERNCFDMTENANNSGKYKVKMKGDIIITDPCYLIKKRDESTRPKWKDFHLYNSIYEYPDYNEETKKSKMFEENNKLLDEADEIWCTKHPNDRDYWDEMNLSNFGFTSYITHDTLYGDWGCHTYRTENNEILGEFCADGGEVGVFLLDEVLKYNPNFTEYLDNKYAITRINDFDGEVWFEKLDSETLIVKGSGNINFFTSQTSL